MPTTNNKANYQQSSRIRSLHQVQIGISPPRRPLPPKENSNSPVVNNQKTLSQKPNGIFGAFWEFYDKNFFNPLYEKFHNKKDTPIIHHYGGTKYSKKRNPKKK